MPHQPAGPTTPAVANSTASDPKRAKRNSWQHKMRAQLAHNQTLESGKAKHSTRRQKPSLPKLPWNDKT